MRNKTYNTIISYLEKFSKEHLDVKRFAEEDEDQMSNITAMGEEFPMLFVAPISNTFDYTINDYSLRIYCYDRLMKDRSNITNIRSKTNQILNDLDVWLRKDSKIPFEITARTTARTFSSELMTDVTGWAIEFDINIPSYEVCEIPFENQPQVTDICDRPYVTYDTLTCQTLSNCESFIQLEEQVEDIISSVGNLGASFGNTYFVSQDGDDTTGNKGNILLPFSTISGARNKLVLDVDNGITIGTTLIYVFPGNYIDDEMQYENGNLYFTPGTTVTGVRRTDSPDTTTAMFLIGSTPKHSPQYESQSCDIFGSADFYLPETLDNNWNGQVLNVRGIGSSNFECNSIVVEKGLGVFADGNSNVAVKGGYLSVTSQGYVSSVRDYSMSTFDFYNIETASSWLFFIRGGSSGGFYGSCVVNSKFMTSDGTTLRFQSMRPNSRTTINCPVITSTNGYAVEQLQANGGNIEVNGNLYGKNGLNLNSSSIANFNMNGNIYVENLAINMGSNASTYNLNFKGDIEITGQLLNAISIDRGTVRLNGSCYHTDTLGTGSTFNGIEIRGAGVLVIETFKVVTDNESVTATVPRDIKVIHSFASNKPLSSNISNLITGSNIIIDSLVE